MIAQEKGGDIRFIPDAIDKAVVSLASDDTFVINGIGLFVGGMGQI